jgi:hypothetical protein
MEIDGPLVIRDASGTPRTEIHPGEIVLRDETGRPRLHLIAQSKVSSVIVCAGNECELCIEGVSDRVVARLRRSGGRQAGAVAVSEEAVSMVLEDERGAERLMLVVHPDMRGQLTLWDRQGRPTERDLPLQA